MACLFGITDVYCMEPSVISNTAVSSHIGFFMHESVLLAPSASLLPIRKGFGN